MTANKLLQLLQRGCEGGVAAIRCVTHLQPSGSQDEKIFPPTYEGGKYATEPRIMDSVEVQTVLLDSVQSQANRLEEGLLNAFRAGKLNLPVFEMNVAGHEITSLTVPHRVHDAILRDSLWDGKPFRESLNGKRLVSARAWNATPFFEFAPTVLLFGTWDSQSGGGVNTAKVARCLVSEIIGVDARRGVRTSSRIDPLGIKLMHNVIEKTNGSDMWRLIEGADGKKPKKGEAKSDTKSARPSEINHGNIAPSITDPENGAGGVTVREAVQTTVLSLTQVRKLRFPDDTGATSTERDIAGRAVISALGLHAVALVQEDGGLQLRSRCHLVPIDAPKFEVIGRTLKEKEELSLDAGMTADALGQALDAAAKHGLKWHAGTIRLEPRPELVKLVEMSDRATGEGE
jgi:CRISPR-associated protein Csb1